MKKITLILVIICLSTINLFGDDFDTSSLFQDDQSVIPVTDVENSSVTDAVSKSSVNFSGNVYNKLSYNMNKKWLKGESTPAVNSFGSTFESDFFVDIRLDKNLKSFLNLSVLYNPAGIIEHHDFKELQQNGTNITEVDHNYYETVKTEINLKEAFIDYNIDRRVYFRVGKQVLQWGRCFFWNPTDLVNVEKKDFFDLTHPREGTNGLKMTVPFGTLLNIYGFVNVGDNTAFNDFSYSGKVEFNVLNSEFAFSTWYKDNMITVYGLDFSTRLLGLDIYGEFSISDGDNTTKLRIENKNYNIAAGILPIFIDYQETGWIKKASIDISKSFDWTLPDRLTVRGEVFYNEAGYDDNMFDNEMFSQYFVYKGYYQPNYYGELYGAVFFTFNSFVNDSMMLMFNSIGNLTDHTGVLSLTLNYSPVYNMNINFTLNGYVGADSGEYTWRGTRLLPQIYTTISF